MKIASLCLLVLIECASILITTSSFGQTRIQGSIIDEQLNAVPYSSITIKDDSTHLLLGTISDLHGHFTLSLPSHYDNDTLKISSVGFETLRIPISQIRDQSIKEFRLRQSATMLPGIVFKGLTAKQLIEACVKEIPINYRNASFDNSAYYWRATKEDSAYKAMDEGIVFVREDHAQGSKRSFTYDSIIERGVRVDNFISFDNFENLFFFDFVRTGSGVTNPDNLNEWKFEFLNINSEQSLHSTVVKATRHDKLGHFIIYVNPMDYAFERVEFSYKWPSTLHPLGESKLYRIDYVDGVVQYQKTSKKYGIKYLFCSFAYSVYQQYTFKKLFSRATDFEFTLLSSREMKYGSKSYTNDVNGKRVVVNTQRYCDALKAFEGSSPLCETNKDPDH